jgi:hypothetical protein
MFQLTQFFVILATITDYIKSKIHFTAFVSQKNVGILGFMIFICKRSRGNVATQRIL